MKKALPIIIAAVAVIALCIVLFPRGGEKEITGDTNNNGTKEEVNNGNAESNNTDTSWLIRDDTVNIAKLRECVEIVKLTTENWKEHFKVYHYSYSYDEEKNEKDAFGEIVSTETVTHSGEGYAFGAGSERYHAYANVLIELKDKTTGELVIYDFRDGGSGSIGDIPLEAEFNLDNYECTRIKGSICYLNIPIGEIPVATMFWPVYPEGEGIDPGYLEIIPGTNSFSVYYVIHRFS